LANFASTIRRHFPSISLPQSAKYFQSKTVSSVLVILYLSLAIHIGVAQYYHSILGWPLFALFFCLEALALRSLIPHSFERVWPRLLLVQFPFILLILRNSFAPVLNDRTFYILIVCCAVVLAALLWRKAVVPPRLTQIAVWTLPLTVVLLLTPADELIAYFNEWRFISEEGQVMSWATKILHGSLNLEDSAINRGPLIIYSSALAMKWFGQTLLVKRAWVLFMNLLMGFGYFYLCRVLFRSKLLQILAFVSLFVIHDYSHRTGFAILSLALFWQFLKHENKWSIFLAGASSTFALVGSIEVGLSALLTILITIALALWLNRERRANYRIAIQYFTAGTLAMVIPLLYLMSQTGGLLKILLGNVNYATYALLGYSASPYPNLIKMVQSDLAYERFLFPVTFKIFVLWYMPILVYLFTFFLLLCWISTRRITIRDLLIFSLCIYGWFTYRSAFNRSDFHHLYFSVGPAFLLCYFHAETLLHAGATNLHHKWRTRLAGIFLCLLPSLFILQRPGDRLIPLAKTFGQNLSGKLDAPAGQRKLNLDRAGGIRVEAEVGARIESLIRAIRPRLAVSDRVYAFPNMAMYYFLLDSPNPTSFEWAYHAITQEMRARAVESLKRSKPKFIIYSNDPRQRLDRIPIRKAVPEIDQFIRVNYKPWRVYGVEEILVPNNLNFQEQNRAFRKPKRIR
jgi:hypothetical protein